MDPEVIAVNEARFRRVNEAIEAGHANEDAIGFVCECGRLGCNDVIELSAAAYERVRSDPRQFVIVPGHEETEVESVIERADGYAIVRKLDEAAEVAEETDPR